MIPWYQSPPDPQIERAEGASSRGEDRIGEIGGSASRGEGGATWGDRRILGDGPVPDGYAEKLLGDAPIPSGDAMVPRKYEPIPSGYGASLPGTGPSPLNTRRSPTIPAFPRQGRASPRVDAASARQFRASPSWGARWESDAERSARGWAPRGSRSGHPRPDGLACERGGSR